MKITGQKSNFHFDENAIYQLYFIDEKTFGFNSC